MKNRIYQTVIALLVVAIAFTFYLQSSDSKETSTIAEKTSTQNSSEKVSQKHNEQTIKQTQNKNVKKPMIASESKELQQKLVILDKTLTQTKGELVYQSKTNKKVILKEKELKEILSLDINNISSKNAAKSSNKKQDPNSQLKLLKLKTQIAEVKKDIAKINANIGQDKN